MTLKEQTKESFQKNNIVPNLEEDQHFLINEDKIKTIIEQINRDDTVLEIGAGAATITQFLVKHVNKVISVELDSQYKPLFVGFNNLEAHFISIWDVINDIVCDCIVANPPYHIARELLHFFFTHKNIKTMFLTIPKKELAHTMQTFGEVFIIEEVCTLTKSDFYPPQTVDSIVLKIKHNN